MFMVATNTGFLESLIYYTQWEKSTWQVGEKFFVI